MDLDELKSLMVRYTKQPIAVLKAYLKAKDKLLKRGLPTVPATGKKKNMTVISYAVNQGLLRELSGKETEVYRTLLNGLPFQYRSLDVIAEEAQVSISTVTAALNKLEAMGLIAKHRVPNSSCVMAFTDTTQLNDEQINALKSGCEFQLIEKRRKHQLNKRVRPTAPPLTVLSKQFSKKEKEYSAPPSSFFFSGGLGANGSDSHQTQSGYGAYTDDTCTHDNPPESGIEAIADRLSAITGRSH